MSVPRRRPRRANIGPRSKRLPTDTSCPPLGVSLFNRSSLYRGPHYHEYNCEAWGKGERIENRWSRPLPVRTTRFTKREMYSSLRRPMYSYHCSPILSSVRIPPPPLYFLSAAKLLTRKLAFAPPFFESRNFEREKERGGVFWILSCDDAKKI